MTKTIITRNFLIGRIKLLLEEKLSVSGFGEEMIWYLSIDDKYELEKGYEEIIENRLKEFMDMHDAGKEYVGYQPYIPSRQKLIETIKILENSKIDTTK